VGNESGSEFVIEIIRTLANVNLAFLVKIWLGNESINKIVLFVYRLLIGRRILEFQGKEKFEKAVQDVQGNMLSGQANFNYCTVNGILEA
jgi:hypothetical protein